MLRRLSVENYALIEKLEMELDPHLNIITGETGAGKSILLGALGLLLGAKNDGSAMKDAARNCVVEGTFDLSGRGMKSFFDENDLDYARSEEHTSELQSRVDLVCRLLMEKKKKKDAKKKKKRGEKEKGCEAGRKK